MLATVLPTLFQDIRAKADKWGDGGRIDPFVEIFDVSTSLQTHDLSVPRAESLFPARFLHDRPYGHVSRDDQERCRFQETYWAGMDLHDRCDSHRLDHTLVP